MQSVTAGAINWRTIVNATEGAGTDGPAAGTLSVISPAGGVFANASVIADSGTCLIGACVPALHSNLNATQPATCEFTCDGSVGAVMPLVVITLNNNSSGATEVSVGWSALHVPQDVCMRLGRALSPCILLVCLS